MVQDSQATGLYRYEPHYVIGVRASPYSLPAFERQARGRPRCIYKNQLLYTSRVGSMFLFGFQALRDTIDPFVLPTVNSPAHGLRHLEVAQFLGGLPDLFRRVAKMHALEHLKIVVLDSGSGVNMWEVENKKERIQHSLSSLAIEGQWRHRSRAINLCASPSATAKLRTLRLSDGQRISGSCSSTGSRPSHRYYPRSSGDSVGRPAGQKSGQILLSKGTDAHDERTSAATPVLEDGEASFGPSLQQLARHRVPTHPRRGDGRDAKPSCDIEHKQ